MVVRVELVSGAMEIKAEAIEVNGKMSEDVRMSEVLELLGEEIEGVEVWERSGGDGGEGWGRRGRKRGDQGDSGVAETKNILRKLERRERKRRERDQEDQEGDQDVGEMGSVREVYEIVDVTEDEDYEHNMAVNEEMECGEGGGDGDCDDEVEDGGDEWRVGSGNGEVGEKG